MRHYSLERRYSGHIHILFGDCGQHFSMYTARYEAHRAPNLYQKDHEASVAEKRGRLGHTSPYTVTARFPDDFVVAVIRSISPGRAGRK